MVAIFSLLWGLCLISCRIGRDWEVCDHNTRLIYYYDREGDASGDVLPVYVRTIEEYIFDERGELFAANKLPGRSSCDGDFVSKMTLPPGRYTVVAWGNPDGRSRIDNQPPSIPPSEESRLLLDAPYARGELPPMQNCERLFYGYHTFTVESTGVGSIVMNMSHAYCLLQITVTWRGMPPTGSGNFSLLLQDVPSQYDFIPGQVFEAGVWVPYDATLNRYLTGNGSSPYYFPGSSGGQRPVTCRIDTRINVDRQVGGEFILYRLNDNSHPLLSIESDGEPVMKTIDLHRFFQSMGILLSQNRRQEFRLAVEIDGDQVTVSLVTFEGWEDGGVLAGRRYSPDVSKHDVLTLYEVPDKIY